MAKKCAKKRDVRVKLLFYKINLLLFLLFLLLSPLLLPKLPFVVIQEFCYHGNVTSHLSSLLISNFFLNFTLILVIKYL